MRHWGPVGEDPAADFARDVAVAIYYQCFH